MNENEKDRLLLDVIKNQTIINIQIQALIRVLITKKILDENEYKEEIDKIQNELLNVLEKNKDEITGSC